MRECKKENIKFRYSIIPDKLLRDSTISGRAKLAWLCLYSMSRYKRSKNPRVLFPLAMIAFQCGIDKQYLQRGIEELAKTPWLSNERRPGKSSVFVLHKGC